MRNKIPQQPAKVRIKNFFEVALGFSKSEARGDIISGADTVISAMGAGKKASLAIDRYINEQYT